jgi:U3 small nucleolar RNA-associated protein 22
MLGQSLSDEAVELLVASLFVTPTVVSPPLSLAAGFLRFLLLLGQHDWLSEPLVIDTSACGAGVSR